MDKPLHVNLRSTVFEPCTLCMKKMIAAVACLVLCSFVFIRKRDERIYTATGYGLVLQPQQVKLANGLSFTLNVPQGYHINVAYEGLKRLRFLTKSPDGRLFATDMYNQSDNKRSKVYIFDGWDNNAKRYTKVYTYLQGLHNANMVAFYKLNGKDVIYVPETGKLSYYEYKAGDTVAPGNPVVVATFPDYGLSYKYGGWHMTRSIAFNNNKLYVSVGSSCNNCIEKENVRATVIEMNPDGSNQRIYASGLRNSVGIKWVNNELWATSMGCDLLGPDKPEDLFLKVQPGKHYGWPYYFQYNKKIWPNVAMMDSAKTANVKLPAPPPVAFCGFKAHSAPLGLDYFKNFSDPQLNNRFLVALHGSTSVWRQRGNAVVKINPDGTYTEVVSGFLKGKEKTDRMGRPCDVMMQDNHSFFITDDHNGVLYYVWK